MSVNGDLNTYLSAHAGLAVLVSSRVYAGIAPQGCAKPYVAHFTVSDIPDYTLTSRTQAREISMQVSCYGSSLASAEAVEAQVLDALEDWPDSDSHVHAVFIEGQRDVTEVNESAETVTDLFHRVIDALILYEEELS